MSSIGSINGMDSTDLSYLIQSLNQRNQTSQSNSTSSVNGLAANDQGIDGLKSKIDDAISEKLKTLDKSSSADEIMAAIKSTVDSTMKENGVDPKAMSQGMPPHGGLPQMRSQGAGDSNPMSKIEQLLKDNGFDLDKFKSELASKMKQQLGSSTSTLSLFNDVTSLQGVNEQA